MAVTPGRPEQVEEAEVLACGRDAAAVWDDAEAGAVDEHARGCPHCAATIADARRLDSLVHRLVAAQELEPPPSVLDRVMGAVLAELRPHDLITLASPHGPARLGRAAAAAVLRHLVDLMDGMRARSCRIEQDTAADGTAPAPADVTITVTARFGVDLASVTARVRQMVLAAGEQALGAPVRRVDIEVVDVFDGSDDDR